MAKLSIQQYHFNDDVFCLLALHLLLSIQYNKGHKQGKNKPAMFSKTIISAENVF